MAQEDHLEHQHHVQRRTPAFLLVVLGSYRFQCQPKALPVYDLIDLEQRIVQFIEFGQHTVLVEKAGLHVYRFGLKRMAEILPDRGGF